VFLSDPESPGVHRAARQLSRETIPEDPMRLKPSCAARAIALSTILAALVIAPSRGEEQPKPKAEEPKKPTVMQRKLAHSQKALEGLAIADFDKIRTAAEGMIACVEDESWKINETKKYVAYSSEFLRRAESLKKAAKDKNIDAAALAYVDMTLTCVRCHQYLREDRIRAVPDLSSSTTRR
jgi:hypothetical protein